MSKISDLAKNFEEKSQQQAIDTKQTLKNEFNKHEAFIEKELRLSELKMKDVIHAQNRRLKCLILKTWFWMPVMLINLLLVSWGVLYYQGNQIKKNLEIIRKQNQKMKELEKYNVKVITSDGVNYLVLPKGAIIQDTYQTEMDKYVIKWK
ncbi:MobB protein (plasmid) [Aliivibrio salmonicida]|nr:MbeB family mobilization protein [Aliivibrio salmonicida]AZL83554.1 MobB protein [Aliivibrio salmonicida]